MPTDTTGDLVLPGAAAVLPAVPEPGTAIDAATVNAIERQVAATVGGVGGIGELNEWRARAAALEAYLRSRDLQRPMLGAARRIEGRIGQLLNPAVTQGQRTDLTPHHGEELVKHDQDRSDFRLLARALSGECPLTEDGWRKSRRALVGDIRVALGLMPETPALPEGRYACVVADPPWTLDTGPDVFGGTGESGHDDLAYAQMSLDAIRNFKDRDGRTVPELAADDAHLYLWTTNRYLRASYDVAEAWGFKPSVMLVWAKTPRGVGLGDTFRLTCEYVLFARRGHHPHARVEPTTWFNWPRGRHSAKPDGFYQLVESVTPGPYVDLFARQPREGWTVWGAEAGGQTT